MFQPARADAEAEAARYTEDYFDSYAHRTKGVGSYDDVRQRTYEARQRVAFVSSYVRGGRLFEVGAASGYFVEEASRAGFDARGIEPSASTAQRAFAEGRQVIAGTLADAAAQGDRYDVVCAWHVLEHLPQPREAMRSFHDLLVEGGWLFLEVPNVESVAAHRRKTGWAHLDASNHVAHYSPDTLFTLANSSRIETRVLESISVRRYLETSRIRSLAQVAFDAVVFGTPQGTHPRRHELLRLAGQATD